jgi:group I intron endonuclease
MGSGTIIKNAIEKYGKQNFKLEILEVCNSHKELNEREIFWINKLNSLYPNGYNLEKGGRQSIMHELTKMKLSKAHKGKKLSEQTKKKLSDINKNNTYAKGKTWSEESKKNKSLIHKGRVSTRKGVKLSDETKEKLRLANIGKKHSNLTIEKMKIAAKNKQYPDDMGRRISEGKKGKTTKLKGKKYTERIECPFCKKQGSGPAMKQWHFKNCKFNLKQ